MGRIVKGDIGIKNGRIVKVGKAGNPDTMEGVDPELVVGPATEVIAGEHRIVTLGAIDSHIHFIAPQQIYEALNNGITTMIGGGTGPATGTNATTPLKRENKAMKLINRKGSLKKEAPDIKRPTQFSVKTSIKAGGPPPPM